MGAPFVASGARELTTVASLKNPRVAAARKLTRRRVRDQERAFLIEGAVILQTAIASGAEILDAFVTDDRLEDVPIGMDPLVVTEQVMRAISDTETPQGIAAVVRIEDVPLSDIKGEDGLILVLAEVRDPGNAGTLLRSAHAAGASSVVFTSGSVDPFSPKTVRASAGSVFGPRIVRDADPNELLDHLASVGVQVVTTDAEAATTVFDVDLTKPSAIVIGNEAWGLRSEPWSRLDTRASVPMPGPAESLNAAVAGSLILFEAVRQRREASS